MSFSKDQIKALTAKLDPKHVKKPSGQFGPKGDYIEGWHAIAEANRIFGFDGWSYRIVDMRECHQPTQNEKGNHAVSFIARVEVTVGEVRREDIGYGSGFLKQLGDAYESATKEAVTDALKRALKSFGNPFGLALYDKTQANVGTDDPADNDPPFGDRQNPFVRQYQDGERKREEDVKKTSAAEMKRGLAEIDKDLLDVHSMPDLTKCANIWKSLMDRDGWSDDYRDVAREKFAKRRDQIKASQDEDDTVSEIKNQFPGARVTGDRPVSTLEAG